MKKKKLGIFLYNRLFDPLIQSNFWLYINDYMNNPQGNPYTLWLITYEDPRYPLTNEQQKLVEQWKQSGMRWIALTWNPGTRISSKVKDIFQGFFAVAKFRVQGCNHFVSLASVAGSYLYLYHVVLRFDFFLYQYEPHSEYAIDNKMWSKNSFQYRIAHYLEKKSAYAAKVIASGTHFMRQRLKEEWKVNGKFFKIATVANDKKFLFSQTNRSRIRNQLGFSDQTRVLFYPGKFGDLYYREETAFMFKWLYELDPLFHFLIVTPHTDAEVIKLFELAQVKQNTYTIVHCDYSEIHNYFAAADFAVIAVPPGPSKKFISNIKVGEYLTAGLPYLITKGISEDYIFATEQNVGVVVDDFKEEFIKKAYPEINQFLITNRDDLRARCRAAGLEYRGFEGRNKTFKEAIDYLCTP
ncbi:MAG: hypothetical protein JSS93_13785 [Bacteroidetes bacterium]|nr:hypothetical protein [Bacteroidota bacterium]